ncbi:hypothetical protein QQS21_010544 [Conoideocrella luteorostrata]|uniref:Cell wall mannoprotein PIR1-like C-terminal domain-containing protein n=1 Tax=Conoideocrella luteorostrata TaxID=1105319 RepID=A0AAJ0CHI9_9HYPO|nr:hypothetical protein QQS21_010544 [Conoideocrella luteorostrata]
MKYSAVAFLGLVASAVADKGAAVTGIVKPDAAAPDGCSTSRDGKFQVSIYSLGNQKRDLQKRACGGEGTLIMTLKDGVLLDSKQRTGYIASNYQFQFDAPAQAGAIYTAGFSTCNNGSLALGGSTVFYRCLSGDFYNLYDRHWAAQCEPIEIVAASCDGGSGGQPGGNKPKPVGTSMVQTTVVTVIADGQPQVRTTVVPVPMCQIGDGQVQVRTTPCASVPPVSQISDGQPQGPTLAPPVSQISDGQIQAPTTVPPPVSQISDGQPQAPTKTAAPPPPPVSQISDGQPQAPTKTAAPPPPPVSQISDGQPQAPTKTGPVVSQISDGQPQAPTSSPPTVTAAAEKVFPGVAAAAVALFGAVLL